MSATQGKYVKSYDGTNIFYEVCVKKNTLCLVFLHGMGGGLTGWTPEVRHFHSKDISTIAIDLLGHGKSDRPDEVQRYAFTNQAKDVLSVLGNEEFTDYILVGHCYGGIVAMVVEADHRIARGLVLIDSADYISTYANIFFENKIIRSLLYLLENHFPNVHISGRTTYRKYKGKGDWYVPRIFEDMMHTSLRSYFHSFHHLFEHDIRTRLKKILVPTLVIVGEGDTIFPVKTSESIASQIKNSVLSIIPHANHVIILNNPEKVTAEIDNFLQVKKLVNQ